MAGVEADITESYKIVWGVMTSEPIKSNQIMISPVFVLKNISCGLKGYFICIKTSLEGKHMLNKREKFISALFIFKC
jgi:hypothetical protein